MDSKRVTFSLRAWQQIYAALKEWSDRRMSHSPIREYNDWIAYEIRRRILEKKEK